MHLKKLAFDEIVRIVGCDLVCRNTPIRKTKYNKFAIAAEKPFVMELTRANRVLNVQNTYWDKHACSAGAWKACTSETDCIKQLNSIKSPFDNEIHNTWSAMNSIQCTMSSVHSALPLWPISSISWTKSSWFRWYEVWLACRSSEIDILNSFVRSLPAKTILSCRTSGKNGKLLTKTITALLTRNTYVARIPSEVGGNRRYRHQTDRIQFEWSANAIDEDGFIFGSRNKNARRSVHR